MSQIAVLLVLVVAVIGALTAMYFVDTPNDGKCPMGFTGKKTDCPFSKAKGVVASAAKKAKKAAASAGGMPNVAGSDTDEISSVDLSGYWTNPRVLSAEEVKAHNGAPDTKDPSSLWLVVLGEVYDVSAGADFYSYGNEYNTFVGKDNSAAFQTGEFKTIQPDVRKLDVTAIPAITGWRKFYRESDKYTFVGIMHGFYFKKDGSPRLALLDVDKLVTTARGVEGREEMKQKTFKRCGMQYSGESGLTTITCESGRAPRLLTWSHESTRNDVQQCVCLPLTQRTAAAVSAELGTNATLGSYGATCDNAPSCTYKPF